MWGNLKRKLGVLSLGPNDFQESGWVDIGDMKKENTVISTYQLSLQLKKLEGMIAQLALERYQARKKKAEPEPKLGNVAPYVKKRK